MVPPMQPEATPDRRSVVVAAVLGTAGLGTVAACGSDAAATSTTVSSTSVATPSSGAAGSATSSATASGSASGATGPSLVKLDQVPVGGAVVVQTATGKVAIAQPRAGEVVGFSAICTHQGCTVRAAGTQLVCPCHGSLFDAFTGQVVQGPAQAPLGTVGVAVSGQDVVAG